MRQPKEGIYSYKVNYKMAVALCREFIRTPGADGEKLMQQIARYTVPIRSGRAFFVNPGGKSAVKLSEK